MQIIKLFFLPFQFQIIPKSAVMVSMDSVTISELQVRLFGGHLGQKGQNVRLMDADQNELQIFISRLPASIKGKRNLFCLSQGIQYKR